MSAPETTLDSIADGRLRLWQHRTGYRFTLDAVLLAAFGARLLPEGRASTLVDLGAGSGVVGLLAGTWRPLAELTLVESHPSLAALCRRNVSENGREALVVERDWGLLEPSPRADLVLSNPPYFLESQGQIPPDPERAAGRCEKPGGLDSLVKAAAGQLKPKGAFRLVHAVSRLPEVMTSLQKQRFRPTVLRFVHPRADLPSEVVLIEARLDARRPLVVEAPLVVHEAEGYSAEVSALLGGRGP